ncbi:hypothetical protein HPB50_028432 [Hyalomma asiaticum]|nr:hypothetical protein HPB50_028432 [Hyalomma asiaticum]
MELCQDIITVDPTTNTITLSTESYDRLTKYLAIKSLKVNGQDHEVTSYSVPNSETCKGIVYIDRVCLGEVISEKDILPTLRECNPQMHFLEARRMGKTSDAVLVTFLGTKVPFWVKCEMAMLRCKPFRQRMEACTRCWTVGHRPDVCPTHKEETCHKCGTVTAPPDHLCIPKCVLCSGRHETGSVQCALRYKPKLPAPKVDKTPPTPNSKSPLQTKKQGPLPKKNQEEEWPPLSATPSGNKPSPPQDRLKAWQWSVPRGEKLLDRTAILYELHFAEWFIVRDCTHVVNGEVVKIPRGCPCLTDDAILSIFPNMQSYLSKKLPQKRSSRTTSGEVLGKKK